MSVEFWEELKQFCDKWKKEFLENSCDIHICGGRKLRLEAIEMKSFQISHQKKKKKVRSYWVFFFFFFPVADFLFLINVLPSL